VSDKPPPFAGYVSGSEDEVWEKILSGEVAPHIYSGEAKGDFKPVPISAAEFFKAEEAGRHEDGEPDAQLKPYQIMWRDRDRRRPSATRRGIPVPHWVYIMKTDREASPQPVAQGPSAPPKAIGSRTPPEQTRAIAILQALFGDIIPPELGFGDLLKRVNNHVGTKARPISKDTLRRALKSLNKRN
jgi:hypothetical protein